MPKSSHLRSVYPTPAPAAHDDAARPSGVSVETVPKPGSRRSFSAAEKLRIVRAAAACTQRGEVEAMLRREGIYSSHLAAWRKQLALHGSEALAAHKPGPKPKLDAKDRRIAELEKRAARLEAKLSVAEKLIDRGGGLRQTQRTNLKLLTFASCLLHLRARPHHENRLPRPRAHASATAWPPSREARYAGCALLYPCRR